MILLYGLIVSMLCFIGAWLWYVKTNAPGVGDFVWPIAITACGLFYLLQQPSLRGLLIGCLLVIWCLRLAGYLWWARIRVAERHERYEKLASGWKSSAKLGFLVNFQVQALFAWIIALPLLSIGQNRLLTLNYYDWICMALIALAIIGETIADQQLNAFKAKKTKGLCTVGLWHHSRHPNLFFEWLIWVGFFLLASRSLYGWWTIISPAFSYYLMVHITGKLTEAHSLEKYGKAFADYKKSTPKFFLKL